MIYIIAGADQALVKKEALDRLRTVLGNFDDFNFASFDMYNDLVQDVVQAAENVSLAAQRKGIVVANCYFLSSELPKANASFDSRQDYQCLIDYLKAPSNDTDIYFLTGAHLLSEKSNELMQVLKKFADVTVLEAKRDEELAQMALRYVGEKKADIDHQATIELVKRCNSDYSLMINSLDKLLCFTSKIRMEDLDLLVAPKLEDSVFSVVTDLLKDNSRDALKSFRDLTKTGRDPISLIPVFAAQFRFFYEVSALSQNMANDIDISKELSCNPFRVKYARRDIGRYTKDDILKMMSDLGELEDHVKFDLDSADTSLELFIVNFKKNYRLASR